MGHFCKKHKNFSSTKPIVFSVQVEDFCAVYLRSLNVLVGHVLLVAFAQTEGLCY